MSSTAIPSWPPSLTQSQTDSLLSAATDYALSHGLVYRPLPPPPTSSSSSSSSPSPPTDSVIHAPFSLVPSPIPRKLFERARSIQPIYDLLYSSIATDHQFLEAVIGGSVAKVDEFQAELWKIYQQVHDEGSEQKLHLGLFRSDYLMHQEEGGQGKGEVGLKQVEFNTISSSFGPLCTKVNELHRHLALTTSFYNAGKGVLDQSNLPQNEALRILSDGLAAGHKAYLSQTGLQGCSINSGATHTHLPYVLFVVQEGERNAFDQRFLEYELLNRHGIRAIRLTFQELAIRARLSQEGSEEASQILYVSHPSYDEPLEISLVYFRAGYGPGDYPTKREWETRLMLERSFAIKCPTVALQLAGAKKVQQVLSEEGILEKLLLQAGRYKEEVVAADGKEGQAVERKFVEAEVEEVRESFTDLYPMDDSQLGRKALKLAMESSEGFVLKPQREGGGNNIYRQDIPVALRKMEEQDLTSSSGKQGAGDGSEVKRREGYILMSLIKPPRGIGNILIKSGGSGGQADVQGSKPSRWIVSKDVVSELGIYGYSLFRPETDEKDGRVRVLKEESGGFLLRTKGRESDEGGVAVGFSVIDSPVLV
ncbi:glutathione synthase [Violaceomyces palustris]|uniref:Glutathione synthase n=1 Tax=Violaceomyces palustris TaxID=1673888 RepID=A0ACD0P7P0_9BASI|nr:glutathione synthase [Violaceomyces palustris]